MVFSEQIIQWTFDKAYEVNYTAQRLSANYTQIINSFDPVSPQVKNMVAGMFGMADIVFFLMFMMIGWLIFRRVIGFGLGVLGSSGEKAGKTLKTKIHNQKIPIHKLIMIKLGLAEIKER